MATAPQTLNELPQDRQHDGGWVLFRAVNALGGFYEVGFRGVGNIYKLLRVAIDQGKPSALDLYHDAMAAAKRVIDVGQGKVQRSRLVGGERLGLFEAVAELSTEWLAADQLLIAAHFDFP